MEKRRFGRTGHMSTVAVFGGAAFMQVTQAEADRAMERVISAGVNHIDVAPSYGLAEERLGPWMERERERFFLGCKTTERTRQGAADELGRSLRRLRVPFFDLYQIHAITTVEELDQVTAPGGALEAAVEARAAGLTRYIGITGHGLLAPTLFVEALARFDFDSVLFPINATLYSIPAYRAASEELLRQCRARDVGTMIIKSVAKGLWGDRARQYSTWYVPFDEAAQVQASVNFVLSQDVTALCTAGDTRVLPLILDACEHFMPMDAAERETSIEQASRYESVFA